MNGFTAVEGVSLDKAREEVNFPILRENLISEDSSIGAGKDSVIREDTVQTLGIISKRRGLLEYGQIMDWMVSEFDKTDVTYKLRESSISRKGDLFQQYVFDMGIEAPDGENISPMVIAKASYVGKPLEILFGTYRFVCSNGAIVGNTLESIQVKGREIGDLLNHSIEEDISRGLDHMSRVSDKYGELSGEQFVNYLDKMIRAEKFPVGLKKSVMYYLSDDGTISLKLEEDGIKLKGEHFATDHPDILYNVESDKSAWEFYNDLTALTTHNTRSSTARTSASLAVSDLFGV